MKVELKRLAFNQGGKETLISVPLMLNRIKNLAVKTLHATVHVRDLQDSKQTGHESVKVRRESATPNSKANASQQPTTRQSRTSNNWYP